MAKNEPIPNEDHISRYCWESTLDEITGNPTGASFELRSIGKKVEEYLSVNWLEKLQSKKRDEQVSEVYAILKKKLRNRVLSDADVISVCNVGQVKYDVIKKTLNAYYIRVLHNPSSGNISHSGIYDSGADDILKEIISQSFIENHLIKNITN